MSATPTMPTAAAYRGMPLPNLSSLLHAVSLQSSQHRTPQLCMRSCVWCIICSLSPPSLEEHTSPLSSFHDVNHLSLWQEEEDEEAEKAQRQNGEREARVRQRQSRPGGNALHTRIPAV